MKMLRLGFAVLALLGAIAIAAPFADEGEYEEGAPCDCWYWQSNKYGVIKTETVDGKPVEKCKEVSCSPKVE